MQNNDITMNGNGFDRRDIDFYYLIGVFFKYKILIISFTFVVGVLSIVYVLTATPHYISTATIYPVNKEEGGILKQLTQTLGISNKTKGYYIFDVLKSRRISSEIIYSKYLTADSKDSINLIEFWDLEGLEITDNKKFEAALNILGSTVSMREDKETSLITISAVTKDKFISRDIVRNYIEATVQYLNVTQQTSTKKSVEFAKNRLGYVREDLENIQNEIVRFQRENSLIVKPDLSMEIKKKIDSMELLRSVVVLLEKEYELLKIEEVKESAVLNILDEPSIVDKPVKPQKRQIVMLNTFVAFILSFMGVILHEKAKKYGVYKTLKNEISR